MDIQGTYDSMFPPCELREVRDFLPPMLPMTLNEELIAESMNRAQQTKQWVLAFVIGTKPCFYKFYGSVIAAGAAGIPYFVIDSNQHYDKELTYGRYEFEFHDKIGVNLAIRGNLLQKSVELLGKLNWLGHYLRERWPNVPVVPVVLGDTIMCSIVPAAWMFSRQERCIHNEAGLRSMAPEVLTRLNEGLTIEEVIEGQFNGPWRILRNEPFPEQWDTFVASAGAEYMFAPTELNRSHLLREGYPEENVFVTGGVVVDALDLKLRRKPSQSIFSIYPQLAEGEWIRVDIHRRGNLTERRFRALVGALVKLVKRGYKVNFIEMNATRFALEKYDLKKDLLQLAEEHENFLYTKIWPEFAHVIEFFNSEHCFAALTDSGGVQEEMNLLGKICLTCRVNTDRPETVKEAHSNLLVPPIDSDFMVRMIEEVASNPGLQERMRSAPKIYGSNVGEKFISKVKELMDQGRPTFSWAHEALGLWREKALDAGLVRGYRTGSETGTAKTE